jgi:DNA-directed RNA polymerase subunit K/omega
MGPKSMIKPSDNKPKKSTVQFLEKPSSKLSHSKTEDLKNNKLHGGISVKDDPDKIDKEEFESEEEEDKDEDNEDENKDDEEEEEEEEVEEVEKEEFDKEKDEDEEGGEGEGDGDECVYRLTKKKNTIDVEIEEGEDMFEDEDMQNQDESNKSKYVKNSERKTKPFLFDFERVRLLGERARQLSLGAKPMIKNLENMDPKFIAKLELEKKIIPLIILRELPNGQVEKWKVSELS